MKFTTPIKLFMQPETISESESGLVTWGRALAQRLHLPTTFVKFLIVGGMGFVVNQVMLYLLYDSPVLFFLPDKDTETSLGLVTHPDIRLLIASVLAVETAIVFQFNAHERWTFRRRLRKESWPMRFVKFQASSIVSPIIIVATTNVLSAGFSVSPYISNAIGVLLGFIWNWIVNSLVIWKDHRGADQPDEPADAVAF